MIAAGIVLTHERINGSDDGPAETAARKARNVNISKAVGRDAVALVRRSRPKLSRPLRVAVSIVFAHKSVVTSNMRPAEAAVGCARYVDVTQDIG